MATKDWIETTKEGGIQDAGPVFIISKSVTGKETRYDCASVYTMALKQDQISALTQFRNDHNIEKLYPLSSLEDMDKVYS